MIYSLVIASLLVGMVAAALVFDTGSAKAQATRIQGVNGWLLPVAGNQLSSDEDMHLRRGSVNAWDLNAPHGSPIFPMAAGVVSYAGCNNAGGFGCWVEINHGGGVETRYAHMVSGSITVSRGQQVDQWTMIGQVGWTGMTSFGPHVHFQIHLNGNRQRIDQYFSRAAMAACNKCNSSGQPVMPTGIRMAQAQAQAQAQAPAAAAAAAPALAPTGYTLSAGMLRAALVGALVAVALGFYVLGSSDGFLSAAVGNGVFVALVCVLLVAPKWLPLAIPAPAAMAQAPATGSGAALATTPAQAQTGGGSKWEIAYSVMRRWEGTRCVHDLVRTFRGVTQSTFNSWRRSQGQPTGDVCQISEREAMAIYYQNYWLKSGADRMPQGLAITHFDFAVNAGVGRAAAALRACTTDVRCYNDFRERFYRSSKSFHLYGAGWLNRLNDIRSISEGKG